MTPTVIKESKAPWVRDVGHRCQAGRGARSEAQGRGARHEARPSPGTAQGRLAPVTFDADRMTLARLGAMTGGGPIAMCRGGAMGVTLTRDRLARSVVQDRTAARDLPLRGPEGLA